MNKRKDLTLSHKQEIQKKFDALAKCTQREAYVQLHILQPLLSKRLKSRINIETACIENQNKNRKRHRCGKDEDVEKVLKTRFVEVRDKNAPINEPMLKMKVESSSEKLGKSDFKATDEWMVESMVKKGKHSFLQTTRRTG